MSGPRVVGLDLSITATGVALADGATDTIHTKPGDKDRRLLDIHFEIIRIADSLPADTPWPPLFAIEEVPPVRANSIAQTGMVHGVVRLALMNIGVPYVLIPPASLKKYATGKGNATKPDMRMALYQRVGLDIRDDNQVDAWWLRAMALDSLGAPVADMPKTHRAALDKVAWPALDPTRSPR